MRRQRRRHRYRWRDYRVVRAVVGDVGATGIVVCELGAVGVVVGVVLRWVGVGKVLGYHDAHDNNGGDGGTRENLGVERSHSCLPMGIKSDSTLSVA
jgi:hypothetical protein